MESTEGFKFNQLLSVHYPGVIKNVSKMLETLGGVRAVSSVYCEKNRKLELKFRPEDALSKPTYGARTQVVALVLKVKIKKRKKEVVSCEPLGCVTVEYQFSTLCDFQYLPSSMNEIFYGKIVPVALDTEWLNSDAPYFLPPAAFSRIDTVQNFNFSKLPLDEGKSNVIGRLKRRRFGCTKCITFDTPEAPLAPKDIPTSVATAKMLNNETLQILNTERPIYSRSAIRCISRVPTLQLKCLLPCVAYYFINGPWRSMWVRFGYDPRKDPSSRIYQTLDYRVRSHLSRMDIKIKRSTSGPSFTYKFSNQNSRNTSVISRHITETNYKEDKCDYEEYIFRPGMVPPSRQCYYQYCDIHVPEVKAMLDNLEEIDDDAVCHEIDGWLPPNMADACRDIMNKYVSEEVKQRNQSSPTPNSLIVEGQSTMYSGSDSDYSESEQF